MCHPKNKLLPLLLLLLCAPVCHAERADREKPLHLESDQLVVDDARQISTFTGNVQLTQGTMVIRGDKVVVVQDKDGFKHGTAYGKPASFRQKREGMDEYIEGYGERIEYDTRAEIVDFYVQARIKRELDEVRGDYITYSAKTEVFRVESNGTAPDAPPKRVRAVLQPKPKPGAAQPNKPDALYIKPSETLTPVEQ